MEYSKEQLAERYHSLPVQVRDLISSTEVTDIIIELKKTHNLQTDQVTQMNNNIMATMVGLLEVDQLPSTLEKSMGLSATQAKNIFETLNTDILQKVTNLKAEIDSKETFRQSRQEISNIENVFPLQYTTLSPEVKKFIDQGSWIKDVTSIGELHFLNPKQIIGLKNETVFVLLNMEESSELPNNIANHLSLDLDESEQIAQNIERAVLIKNSDIGHKKESKPEPIDPMIAVKEKLAKISSHGRFPIETLTNQFKALPKKIQELIVGDQMAASITPLAKKYDLHIDQSGRLAETAILVMLGLIKTTEFISELEKSLGVTKIKAGDIAYEVDQKLFKPMREILKHASEEVPDNQNTRVVPISEQYQTAAPTSNSPVEQPAKTIIDPYREPIN